MDNYTEYIEEEYKRHYVWQRTENARLRAQLIKINDHRTELKQKIVALEQRMSEVEESIGTKDDETDDGLSIAHGDINKFL